MSRPNPVALAALLEERLHDTYDDGGDWDITAHAVDGIVAIALEDENGSVHEFRAVIVEGDAAPVVAACPDFGDPAATCGPGIGYENDPHIYGWTVGEVAGEVVFGGTGRISHTEARRMGAALIAVADAHDDQGSGSK